MEKAFPLEEAAGRDRLKYLDFWIDSIFIALEEGKEKSIGVYQAHEKHVERMEHYPDWISNIPRS